MSSRGLALAHPAKNVVVYRNGDPFFHGRKFVVNQRQFLTFEAFLNELFTSWKEGAPWDEQQQRCAGESELSVDRQEQTETSPGLCVADNKPHLAAASVKAAQAPPGGENGTAPGSVFRNGDLLSPPFQLKISKRTLLQWDALLAMLTEKVDLCSRAVSSFPILKSRITPVSLALILVPFITLHLLASTLRFCPLSCDFPLYCSEHFAVPFVRLCRLDGVQVSSGEELENGNYYVAVGAEEYRKLPYLELLVPQDSVWRTLWYVGMAERFKESLQWFSAEAILPIAFPFSAACIKG
ncbi:UNVERIFIED_CONTAM: hypothetical protein H355_000558 [Colinus virginianus]|nr:hypothetical protein H355_000558 [Colinus virginianus]